MLFFDSHYVGHNFFKTLKPMLILWLNNEIWVLIDYQSSCVLAVYNMS